MHPAKKYINNNKRLHRSSISISSALCIKLKQKCLLRLISLLFRSTTMASKHFKRLREYKMNSIYYFQWSFFPRYCLQKKSTRFHNRLYFHTILCGSLVSRRYGEWRTLCSVSSSSSPVSNSGPFFSSHGAGTFSGAL